MISTSFETMKPKKENQPPSAVQNEEIASPVRRHVRSDSSGISGAVNRNKADSSLTLARNSARRPQSALSLREYSSVLKCSLVSGGSSVVPMSGHIEGKMSGVTSDSMAVLALTRLKSARRAYEGGPMSEERFRAMQAESYYLKKELADKDEQHKALVVSLNRAEDAVKRKLRASVEHISLLPKQKFSALAVLTENYNTEKKIQELEERLRVGRRDNLKYLQYVRRYRSETEWYKKRLEAMTRASRRAKSCNCQRSLKRYEKMVKDLRKQLSSFEEEKRCMSDHFRDQSVATADILEYSTEDPILCLKHPIDVQKFRSQYSQTEGDILGVVFKPDKGGMQTQSHLVGNVDESERYGMSMLSPSDMVRSRELKADETPFKEGMGEQSIGDTLSTFNITTQLMKTWEKLTLLTTTHNKTMEELRLLKVNQECSAQMLQGTCHELNQERRKCLRLEAAEKRLTLELTAAKHVDVLLQQVRQQNVQLEIENAELVASALNVPRTNFSELKSLRQQLVNELKERKVAEANASKAATQLEDCKQELARLAVVEANWEYLKSELAAAKMAVCRADERVKELQDSNKWLQKQISLKALLDLGGGGYRPVKQVFATVQGMDFLQKNRHVAQIPSTFEEETEMDSSAGRVLEVESEVTSVSTVSDDHTTRQNDDLEKYQTSDIGLPTLRHRNKFEMRKCFAKSTGEGKISCNVARKLCTSIPRLHTNHISLTILHLELNACTYLSSFRKICVCFQFLAKFCEPNDQCTPSVPNDQAVLHYSYSRAFSVEKTTHGDARECLKKMLDSEATAYIQFQVFGEGIEGQPKVLLGTCQVDLWAAMYQDNATDSFETQLEVISKIPSLKSTGIGKLHVVVSGVRLLRDIHGLAMPASPATPYIVGQ